MNIMLKKIAGQPIISWILQLILIWIAWSIHKHTVPDNIETLIVVGILVILIYLSLAFTGKSKK